MHIVGVIAEYNPFHNGHLHHLEETRRMTGCEYLVVAMSGAFTQRGEPALVDKWTRARMALACGADLVLELPALFALGTADRFATGGVTLLSGLGVVDELSFGCEAGGIAQLREMADALAEEPPTLREGLRRRLEQGQSHARARGEALAEYLHLSPEQVNAPNTVLALEYLRANRALGNPLKLCAVPRVGDYHSNALGEIASASAIRAALRSGRESQALAAMPPAAAKMLRAQGEAALSDPDRLDDLLLYRLRGLEAAQIARLPDVNEGLEMRLKRAAAETSSRAELLRAVKCKRYTMARLSRLCAYALLGLDRALQEEYPQPPYARVLGFRDRARPLLREIASAGTIPLASDPMQIKDERCFLLERRATDLWGLTTAHPALRRAGRDLTERMLILYDE